MELVSLLFPAGSGDSIDLAAIQCQFVIFPGVIRQVWVFQSVECFLAVRPALFLAVQTTKFLLEITLEKTVIFMIYKENVTVKSDEQIFQNTPINLR